MSRSPRIPHAAVLALAGFSSLAPIASQGEHGQNLVYTGRVVDERGEPIKGAGIVWGDHLDLSTDDALTRPRTTSGADGRFRIEVAPRIAHSGGLDPAILVAAPGHVSIWPHIRLVDCGALKLDVGSFVLPKGVTLVGRVKDHRGKPVAGVVVRSRDLLHDYQRVQYLTTLLSFHHLGRTVTDVKGIFKLRCTYSGGLELSFAKPGFFLRRVSPVTSHTPLSVTMHRSGVIAGVVTDAKGKGVETKLTIQFKDAKYREFIKSDADGRFLTSLYHPGGYEVFANRVPGDVGPPARTGLLLSPRGTLDLQFKPGQPSHLIFGAESQKTRRPIKKFEMTVFWGWQNLPAAQFRDHLRGRPTVHSDLNGRATLPSPEPDGGDGAVLVRAAGFADQVVSFSTRRAYVNAQIAKMNQEAVIRGKVVDAETGRPIAGAKVWPVWMTNGWRSLGRVPLTASTTDARGRYRIDRLNPGTYTVHALVPGRFVATPVVVEVIADKLASGRDLLASKARTLIGKIHGVVNSGGCVVEEVASGFADDGPYRVRITSEPRRLPVAKDGSFTLTAASGRNHALVLVRPSGARGGRRLRISLGTVSVTKDGPHAFSPDEPGHITGNVRVKCSRPVFDRLLLLVSATRKSIGKVRGRSTSFHDVLRERLAVGIADSRGRFSFELLAGEYILHAFDIVTGLELYRHDKPIVVEKGKASRIDPEFEVRLVKVRWNRADARPVTELTIRDGKVRRRRAKILAANYISHWVRNGSITIDGGQQTFEFIAAPGAYDLDATILRKKRPWIRRLLKVEKAGERSRPIEVVLDAR